MIGKSPSKRTPSNCDVLVLAPRFPSINQPWIDTYLEQLQKNSVSFYIVSTMRNPNSYHDKVNRLGLLNYKIPVIMERKEIALSTIKFGLSQPSFFFAMARHAQTTFIKSEIGLKRIKAIMRGCYSAYSINFLDELKLIHAHSEFLCYYFLPVASYLHVPIVLTFHGIEPHGVEQFAVLRRKKVAEQIRSIVVNTMAAKQQAVSLGYPAEKIFILPQGLPLEDFPFGHRAAPQRNEVIQLLSVGRYHRDKGQAYALKALKMILDRGISAHWHFVGVGPDKNNLATMSQDLGVANMVTFHIGLADSEVKRLYRNCHLFVLPSLSNPNLDEHVETQGVVLQEAQASGCIPIATRVGGIPECIRDHVDGLLIKDRSSRAIADAVCYMLDHPELWESYQREGRRNVEQRFNADIIGNQMAQLLRQVMRKGKST